MTTHAVATPTPIPVSIPVRQILPYAIFVGIISLIALYFVGAEQGALAVFDGTYVHELVHDARHLLGFPCH